MFVSVVAGSVVSKDRSAGKAEHGRVGKNLFNIFVGFAKLRAVACVEDKDNAFVS